MSNSLRNDPLSLRKPPHSNLEQDIISDTAFSIRLQEELQSIFSRTILQNIRMSWIWLLTQIFTHCRIQEPLEEYGLVVASKLVKNGKP